MLSSLSSKAADQDHKPDSASQAHIAELAQKQKSLDEATWSEKVQLIAVAGYKVPDDLQCILCACFAKDGNEWMIVAVIKIPDRGVLRIAARNPRGHNLCRCCFQTGCQLYPGKPVDSWVPPLVDRETAKAISLCARNAFDNLPPHPLNYCPSNIFNVTVAGMRIVVPCFFVELPQFTDRWKYPPEAFGLTTIKMQCESLQMVEGVLLKKPKQKFREVEMYLDVSVQRDEVSLQQDSSVQRGAGFQDMQQRFNQHYK